MSELIDKGSIRRELQDLSATQVHVQFENILVNSGKDYPILKTQFASTVARVRTRHRFAANDDQSLTFRESETLVLLGKGLSVKGIARNLDIAPGTVKWHIKNLYKKLEVGSREDALRKARLRKIIPQ